jgi:hypothetical protein
VLPIVSDLSFIVREMAAFGPPFFSGTAQALSIMLAPKLNE